MHKKCYYTTTFFDKIQIQEEMRIQSLYNDDKNSCKMPWGHILPFASSPYQSSATQIPLHFYLAKGLNTNSVFRSFIFRLFGRKYEREQKQTKQEKTPRIKSDEFLKYRLSPAVFFNALLPYDKVSANTASLKPQCYKKSGRSQDACRGSPDMPNEPSDY